MALLKSVGKALWKNKINAGIGVWSGMDTYQTDREDGVGTLGSLAHAGLEAVLPIVSMPLYLGYEVLNGAPGEIMKAYDSADKWRRQLAKDSSNRAFTSAQFSDTQQTYTMRQRGMVIAQRSQYNTQQAMLGNEAKYMMR